MRTLRVVNPSINAHPHLPISSPILLAHFPPTRRKSRKLAPRKWSNWKTSCSVSAACVSSASAEYQGWDDPRLGSGSGGSGESNQLTNFMASIGIDDKKYVYVFALGIVCALTISRVRLGWIVVIPASVVVFALGFSFGFVRSVTVSDVDVSGGGAIGRKRIENGDFRLEKLSSVVSFFHKLDARIGRLRDDVNRAVVEKHVTLGELERCVVELDSARSLALPARGVLEACVVELRRAGDRAAESEESAGKKGKEPVESGFGFSKFAAAIFGNKRNESRAGRMKDSKRNGGENELNREVNSGVAGDSLEGNDFNMLRDDREGSEFSKQESNVMQSVDDAKRVRMPQGEKSVPFNFNGASDGFNTREEYSYMRNKMKFADNSRLSFKMRHRNEIESWRSSSSSSSSSERVLDYQLKQTEASFEKEQILNKSVESFESSGMYEHGEEEMNLPRVRRARMPPRDDHFAGVADATSSAISSDVLFDRYLKEANDLLKQARDSLKDGDAEDAADDMLYRSSELLSMALDMKPMSLLAVGLLGNSYLLHGELKLKVSRKLRALLRKNRSSRRDWQGREDTGRRYQ
uniref:Uncharacterized protein n=1 Tax=Kalanchoe fedtschenkoi TaxID=63787 RepID=A0A7N0TKQ7_KALFE